MEIQQLNLLFRLFIAHLLADFVFQTDRMAKGKQDGLRSGHFYIHIIVVGILTYLLLAEWTNWWAPVLIMVMHGLIDLLKVSIKSDSIWVYVGDQLLHVLTVIFLWILLTQNSFCSLWRLLENIWQNEGVLIIIIAYLLVSMPTSVLIGCLTKSWQNKLGGSGNDSLKDAGKWIGMIERILILTFILINQWAPIGFLLAAKSVFRFGDLKEGADRKKTEYILIGTLLSFTFSIFLGIIIQIILNKI